MDKLTLSEEEKQNWHMISSHLELARTDLEESEDAVVRFVRSLIERVCDEHKWNFRSLVWSTGFIDPSTIEPHVPPDHWIHLYDKAGEEFWARIQQKYLGTLDMPNCTYEYATKKWAGF